MTKSPTRVHDAFRLLPTVFGDARGFFLETWNRQTFRDIGIDFDFVQDNHSHSSKNVLRGLHYQSGLHAQGKLVWVTSGRVFDVFVDLRKSSPTYGQWDAQMLTNDGHERLWVPPGCAHGFLVCSDEADFHYKCTAPYAPQHERVLRWDDPTLQIPWPLAPGDVPTIAKRDADGPDFLSCEKYE